MRISWLIVSLLISFCRPLMTCAAEDRPLPSGVISILNSKYSGWMMEKMVDSIYDGGYTNRLDADFDGDRRPDIALQIGYVDSKGSANKASIAFLNKGNYYEDHLLSQVFLGQYKEMLKQPGDTLLQLIRKGEKRTDWSRIEEFTDESNVPQITFKRDCVEVVTMGKAASAFVYENGTFRQVITGD